MKYHLYNKLTHKVLSHPRNGRVQFQGLDEAKFFLTEVYALLDDLKMPEVKEHIVITPADSIIATASEDDDRKVSF